MYYNLCYTQYNTAIFRIFLQFDFTRLISIYHKLFTMKAPKPSKINQHLPTFSNAFQEFFFLFIIFLYSRLVSSLTQKESRLTPGPQLSISCYKRHPRNILLNCSL